MFFYHGSSDRIVTMTTSNDHGSPRRPRSRRTGTPTYVAPEDQPTYPPDPYWATDERGRFRYVWVDKGGEGPVYIRKEHILLIVEAITKASA